MAGILIVEDGRWIAISMAGKLSQRWPNLKVTFVFDALNAVKALTNERFTAYFPRDQRAVECEPMEFEAVIWDNQFPRNEQEKAEADVGLETAAALATSGKVSETVRSRFIMHSADDSAKFEQSGIFAAVLPKPMDLRSLEPLFEKWGLGTQEKEAQSSSDVQ